MCPAPSLHLCTIEVFILGKQPAQRSDFPASRSAAKFINLDLANKKLKGEIPSEIGQLLTIEFLVLSGNALTGML